MDWGVLVLPGGAYRETAPREGEPVAEAFRRAGFSARTLSYSVAPSRWPAAFAEAARAVSDLREAGCRRVAVCGFSAGGHLAGCLANLWRHPALRERGLISERVRPDAAVLAYPVISTGPFGHRPSVQNLLGGGAVPPELSLEESVTPENPPAFLWATLTDGTVPAENTLLYAMALRRAGVPFELHLYPRGPHAMALADGRTLGRPDQQDPHVAGWFRLCLEWLRAL